MSLVTTITLTVGFAIAKQMISAWIGEGVQNQVTQDLLDLCRDRLDAAIGNKAERKQLDQVAQKVINEMTPLWESECRRLDAGARTAVVLAVGQTLASNRIDAAALIQNRLDVKRLAKMLSDQQRQQVIGFSTDELAVYEHMLAEASRQIVYLAENVTGYGPLVDRHMLLGLDQVLAYLEHLLSGPAETMRIFEEDYLRALPATKLGRFDVIGIPYAEDAVRQQNLDMAYDGLRLEVDERVDAGVTFLTVDEMEARTLAAKGRLAQTERSASRIGTIQEMLAHSSRLVIRGQPGSGKSTLLRWLALRRSRRALGQDVDGPDGAAGVVPFYLPLRSFKQGGIPKPADWPALNVPKLAQEPPAAWMRSLLMEGRALVLIDGVDEVSINQRRQLLEELAELVQMYPLTRYVITSRPAAIKNWPEWSDWMRAAGFVTTTLQEMEVDQVSAFVDQWHAALLTTTIQAEELARIRTLPAALKQLLRQRLPLRQLARNPLLCTMICALHRERPHNMPQNRVKLYQDCVEMLLYKRDSDRGVGSMDDYPPLTHTHEEVVLRDYAHHLLINGDSEETIEDAESYFDQLLEAVNMPEWTGEKLRDYFVKRTGLLIEPAVGRIAFAHRTFLEFLAARVIVKKNEIKMLLDKARDDQWRETILLTVALPEINDKQSERLFRGLLKKADGLTTARSRNELYLLAVACMECPIYLPEVLRQEVLAKAAPLIPPRHQDAATLLAKAGDPIVELLQFDARYSYAQMARCVEALAEIGSERALVAIAAYCASPAYEEDGAFALRRSIGAAIWRFDSANFCRRVLARVGTLDLSSTQVGDAELAHLAGLGSLQTLDLSSTQVSDAGLAHLAGLGSVQWLDLSSTQVSDAGLAHLAGLGSLQWLDLRNTQVSDAGLAHLAGLGCLQWLDLSSTQVSDAGLVHLAGLGSLQTLDLRNTQVSDGSALDHLLGLDVEL